MIQLLPNPFGSDVQTADNLYGLLFAMAPTEYTLNLENTAFIKPTGVMALVLAARHLTKQSNYPVRLINLNPELLAYLERVNLFTVAKEWLQLNEELPAEQRWERNPQTANLLELTPITNADDVARVMERAEAIFSRWLQLPNLGSLLKVISELCSNIYQHSGDPHGFVMIQRYRVVSRNEVDVVLAAGDMGRGIRGSLSARYPELSAEPLAYIQAALEGSTSRHTGRGGLGLRIVEETVAKEGGYVWLRSETAAISSRGPDHRYPFTDLAPMPGTQVVVEFRAPLKD
jgi:signal transduction histidine kinase